MSEHTKTGGRRNFIKHSVAGLTGAVLAPSVLKMEGKPIGPQEGGNKLVHRTLGRTGIKVPVVSMGTYNATSVINAALDAGITHIDTSADYNKGNDERMFGKVFKSRPRDSIVIGTSIGMWQYRTVDQVKTAIDAAKLREYIEGSLERLDVDFIDIYYLGGVQHTEIALHKPYLDVLAEYKQAGKLHQGSLLLLGDHPYIAAQSSQFLGVQLGVAAGHQKQRGGMLPGDLADQAPGFLLALGGNGAGIDHIDIRRPIRSNQRKALVSELRSQGFGFVLIELAPEGLKGGCHASVKAAAPPWISL